MRVYELAKELGLSAKEVMDVLGVLRIAVKSHSSSLSMASEERVRAHVAATRPKGKKASAAGPVAVAAPVEPQAQRPEGKTPTGERILGVRKIVLPPAPVVVETPPPPAVAPISELPTIAPAADAVPSDGPMRAVERPAAQAPAAAPPAAPTSAPLQATPESPAAQPLTQGIAASAPPVAPAPPRPGPAAPPRTPPRPGRPDGRPGPVRIEPVRPPRRDGPREGSPRPSVSPTPPAAAPPADKRPPQRLQQPAPDRRRPPGGDGRPVQGKPTVQPRRPVFHRLPKRRRAPVRTTTPEPVKVVPKVAEMVELTGAISVGELAAKLQVPGGEIVKRLLERGVLAGINQQIQLDMAVAVAESFGTLVHGHEARAKTAEPVSKMERLTRTTSEQAATRSPVVTVMGHVDHGKTSLLDAIRQTKVAEGEAGGITQHIGASVIDASGRQVVFIDTPGHEAFTTLRARGAQVTDIAVLVVAADDGVMPQTIEALNHARAAGVPVVVAINKMDLPQANPDRVKQSLAERGLVPEDWGGDTIMVPVSARQRTGIDQLLEMLLLVADLQELKAEIDRPARGTIIEARLDRGRGPVATVLIQEGTLNVGDAVVTGETFGRVRAMVDARGQRTDVAGPSTPVEVLGLVEVPSAGDLLEAVRDERMARAVAEERRERRKAADLAAARPTGADTVGEEGPRELRLIIKADTHGSIEALTGAIPRLSTSEVKLTILHTGVGNVTESDIMLAAASRASVIGFNVRPDASVRKVAEHEHIDVRLYRIIYEALEDLQKMQRGLVAPKTQEVVLGQAEVRQVFTISRLGTIAGSYVTGGRIVRGALARLIRDGVVVHQGRIGSLRRFKDDVREVTDGFECGIGLERFNDVKERDVIEAYEVQQVPA
jgi:translation initiation factor IF-2